MFYFKKLIGTVPAAEIPSDSSGNRPLEKYCT